jgi:hypothetical protein
MRLSNVILSALIMAGIASAATEAGRGYFAVLPQKVLLSGKTDGADAQWSMVSGPAVVVIEKANEPVTWVKVTQPGKYTFSFRANVNGKVETATTWANVYPEGAGFGNPILPGMFPDPHILFDKGLFYIYATSMETDSGKYGRASVWSSRDFVNWQMELTNYPEYGKFGGDIWAPDIIKKGEKFYQFITRSGGYDTWVAVADAPKGPWKNLREDNTPIVSGGGKAGRIVPAYNMDAQPFIDDDGQAYMYWGWSDSMAAKLTPDLKEIDGKVVFLKGTKWVAANGQLPQWLIIDLGTTNRITNTLINPEYRHVAYQYVIEVSNDKQNWTLFVSREQNKDVAGQGYCDQGDAQGRYVRITLKNCGGHWASLFNVSVYGWKSLLSLDKPAEASSSRGGPFTAAAATDDSTGPNMEDFVEGSYMIMRKGTYYLLYSSGALHDGSYSVHYATSQHPLGPFATPPNNKILKINEEQTTRGPGHNSVLKLGERFFIVYHQHNQPHEDGALVYRQTCADELFFNADGTIKPVVPTQTGVGALQTLDATRGRDVAYGKYATATSVRSVNYAPEYALDHHFASKWKSATNDLPQVFTVDLKGTFDIDRVETCFEFPTLSYKYSIETSLDGKAWSMYADKHAEFTSAVCPVVETKQATAGFVRMTIFECQRPENGAGIYTFKVYSVK